MATASDFVFIINDNEAELSEATTDRVPANPGSPPGPITLATRTFEFGADHPTTDGAVLTYMVRALSNADYAEPEIAINGRRIGAIQRSVGAHPQTWYTQVIRIDSGVLQHGINQLKISLALRPGKPFDSRSSNNDDDSFFVRAMVCQYRKQI